MERKSDRRRSRRCARSTPKAAAMRAWAISSTPAVARSTPDCVPLLRSSPAISISNPMIRCTRGSARRSTTERRALRDAWEVAHPGRTASCDVQDLREGAAGRAGAALRLHFRVGRSCAPRARGPGRPEDPGVGSPAGAAGPALAVRRLPWTVGSGRRKMVQPPPPARHASARPVSINPPRSLDRIPSVHR